MDDHSLNDRLGEKLRAAGDAPESTAKNARIVAGVVIALGAAGIVLVSKYWIGS